MKLQVSIRPKFGQSISQVIYSMWALFYEDSSHEYHGDYLIYLRKYFKLKLKNKDSDKYNRD